MAYREHLPHPALRPFVDRFWSQAPEAPEDRTAAPGHAPAGPRLILPDGCIDLIVNLTSGRAVAVGTMTRALELPAHQAGTAVAVRFRPGGAVPFLRVPAHELTDAEIAWADLPAQDLHAPALDPGDNVARGLLALQEVLLEALGRAQRPLLPDRLVAHAVRAMLAPQPGSIEAIARRLGWSRQHLRRAFRANVGIGPKQFDRVARLQRAVAQLQSQPRESLAGVAATVGYFDQAHMTGDFRALTGTTPKRLRGAKGSIFPILSLFDGA